MNHRFVGRLSPGSVRPGSASPLSDFRQRWDSLESETVNRQVRHTHIYPSAFYTDKNVKACTIKCTILITVSSWWHSDILYLIEQHQLECALLGLGQFQNNFDELHAWISHTAELLQASRPISIDLQTCEIELAKHKVYAVYTVFFIAVVLKVVSGIPRGL